MNVILTIVKVHAAPQRTVDFRPGLGGLNQVYVPNRHKKPFKEHIYWAQSACRKTVY